MDRQSTQRIFELLSVMVAILLVSRISAAPGSLQASMGNKTYVHEDSNKNFAAETQLPDGRRRSERYEIVSGQGAQSDHSLVMGSQIEVEVVRLQNRKKETEKRRKNVKSKGMKRRKNKKPGKRKNENRRRREKGKGRKSKGKNKGRKTKGKNKGRKRTKDKVKYDQKNKEREQKKYKETVSNQSSQEKNPDELTESTFPCSILYVAEMTRDLCESQSDIDPGSYQRITESELGGTQVSQWTLKSLNCHNFHIGQVQCDPLTMVLPSSGIKVTLACIPQRPKHEMVVSQLQDE
ncbi:uncharacterized protein [Penaeus vannamei]|uniref:uncharacterized protein n=1 Tax=Penaeus vannamei TaxID=6689 RepID=UPI00387FA8F6